jgi:cytoskeletal protein CcmA (bactofilin family)
MFVSKLSRKLFSKNTVNPNTFSGVLPEACTVEGNIVVSGATTVKIEGHVNGSVIGDDKRDATGSADGKRPSVIIAGNVRGDIKGFDHVIIDGGSVIGNVEAFVQLTLMNNSYIKGSVNYNDLVIESGSRILGSLDSCWAESQPSANQETVG